MADLVLRTQAHELCVGFPHVTEKLYSSTRSDDAASYVVVRRTNEAARRSWDLRWRDIERSALGEIRRRVDSSKGGALSMDFTPFGETDATKIKVRIRPDSFRWRITTANRAEARMTVVEDL